MARLRVVPTTGENYLLVFDRAENDAADIADLASATPDMRESFTNCGGVLVVAFDLEVE